jgi:hypothetical protein
MFLNNVNKIVSDERQLKSLIWLKQEEFKFLSILFEEIEKEVKQEEYEERLKKSNWKQVRMWSLSWNTKIKTSEDKLFLILYYLKTYPTFDVLWFHFWVSRWTACKRVHKILPILQRLLKKLWISPKRELKTTEDLKEAFWWNILDLIIDWTERRHFRHKENSKQKENYSGKKNVILKRIQ